MNNVYFRWKPKNNNSEVLSSISCASTDAHSPRFTPFPQLVMMMCQNSWSRVGQIIVDQIKFVINIIDGHIYELLHRKSVRNVCYRGVTIWITE